MFERFPNIKRVAQATGLNEKEIWFALNEFRSKEIARMDESEILENLKGMNEYDSGIVRVARNSSLNESQIHEILEDYWFPCDADELSEREVIAIVESANEYAKKKLNEKVKAINESSVSSDIADVKMNALVSKVSRKTFLNEAQIRRIIGQKDDLDILALTESKIIELVVDELLEAHATKEYLVNKKADSFRAAGINHSKHPASATGVNDYRRTNKDEWSSHFAFNHPGVENVGNAKTDPAYKAGGKLTESKEAKSRVSQALHERAKENSFETNSLLAIPAHMV